MTVDSSLADCYSHCPNPFPVFLQSGAVYAADHPPSLPLSDSPNTKREKFAPAVKAEKSGTFWLDFSVFERVYEPSLQWTYKREPRYSLFRKEHSLGCLVLKITGKCRKYVTRECDTGVQSTKVDENKKDESPGVRALESCSDSTPSTLVLFADDPFMAANVLISVHTIDWTQKKQRTSQIEGLNHKLLKPE